MVDFIFFLEENKTLFQNLNNPKFNIKFSYTYRNEIKKTQIKIFLSFQSKFSLEGKDATRKIFYCKHLQQQK